MSPTLEKKFHADWIAQLIGIAFFVYLFFGFMLLP